MSAPIKLLMVGLLGVVGLEGCGETESSERREAEEAARHGLTPEQASETLVAIGDHEITVGEFADQLADQPPLLRARYNSPERRREFLDNLVRFELLAKEALRRGFDRHPDAVRAKKQLMIQRMMKDKFGESIRLSDITEPEIKAYYEKHRDEFHKPEQVRASHILVSDAAQARQVLRQALARETDMEFFRQLATRHSEDPETKTEFGDLRFFSRPSEPTAKTEDGRVPGEVAEAAFRIKEIGKVHPKLVQTERGYHIIKLVARRPALRRSLEETRRHIQNRLWREKRERKIEQFVKELRRRAKVEENLEALQQVRLENDDPE